MRFVVSSASLLKYLQQVNGVISTNTVLPILEDFLFDIDQNTLRIVATDLETVLRVEMEVQSTESGRVCIPAKVLVDSLKNIPEQPLTFTVQDNYAIEITSQNGKYKVMGENPNNYPKEPNAEDTNSFTMASGALVTAINKSLFAVSNDDLRPAMTGVYFELGPDQVQFVATDAHRLVRYRRTDTQAPQTASFIVPKKPLNLLRNVLPDNEEPLEVSYNANYLFVQLGKTQLICRLIDARFPDYKVVIPSENPFHLTVSKAGLQSALRRIMVFSNKSTNQVVLDVQGSELVLRSQDVDFSYEGQERMECQYSGEDMQIAFNARFLLEMLGAADTEEIRLELSTPTRAGLIKPTEQGDGEDLLMLVMPLMINN